MKKYMVLANNGETFGPCWADPETVQKLNKTIGSYTLVPVHDTSHAPPSAEITGDMYAELHSKTS